MTPDPKDVPIILALGSNLGDRLDFLRKTIEGLRPFVTINAVSAVYETSPAYVADQPVFLNAVVMGTTALEPLALLWTVKGIENELGRTPTFRYGPRVIDIDIVFYGDKILKIPELSIPHPRVQERDFVLRPLCDIAPDWKHPETDKTAAEMLNALPPSTMTCLGKLLP